MYIKNNEKEGINATEVPARLKSALEPICL